MDAQGRGILTLLRSGLTGEGPALPGEFALEQAYEQLKRHQVLSVAYLGAVNCGVSKSLPVMRRLFEDYCSILYHSERQWAVLERLLAAFDEAGIDHMPLKGYHLKPLYPAPELRPMGDADILIRLDQYDAIRPVMRALGFEEGAESDHELVWHHPDLMVELHKRLIPSYNKDYYGYYGDGWQLARVEQGCRYGMEAEDELVYLITHFAKHYRDGGIGLRHVLDLWVWQRAKPGLDMVRVERVLARLRLLEFYQNIQRLLRAWFEDGAWDETLELMTHVIFSSGSWGTKSAHLLSAVLREAQGSASTGRAKLRRLWRTAFLPLEAMRTKYPVLCKAPVLLPVCWCVRIVRILFFERDTLARRGAEFSYASEQRVEQYSQALHCVGLDFDFKECSD